MRFDFEYITDLEPDTMRTAMFGHEPDGRLIQYHMNGDYAENRSAMITQGLYGTLADDIEDEPPRMTGKQIFRIGVKSLVGLGAYGFYVSQDERGVYTRILLPINYTSGGPPPTLIIGQTDTTLTYAIGNPDLINYECFRLTFRRGHFAYEFITYDVEGELEKPFDMEGEYSVTCIGYKNEISEFSEPTEPVDVDITKRSDAPEPDLPIDINAVIAAIEHRLIPPGGLTDESLIKASDADYDTRWALIEGGVIPPPPLPFAFDFAEPLDIARVYMASGRIGVYALYAGGNFINSAPTSAIQPSAIVDAYDNALTRLTAPGLNSAKMMAVSCPLDNYLVIMGGVSTPASGSTLNNTADAYDESLTRTGLAANNNFRFSSNMDANGSTKVGGSVVLFGGVNAVWGAWQNRAHRLNESLSMSILTAPFGAANVNGASASTDHQGTYGIVAAGRNSSNVQIADVTAYNTAFTRLQAPNMIVNREFAGSGTTLSGALFVGGLSTAIADVYDNALTRTNFSCSHPSNNAAVANIGNFIFISYPVSGDQITEVYDESFTRVAMLDAPMPFNGVQGSHIPVFDDFALFKANGLNRDVIVLSVTI